MGEININQSHNIFKQYRKMNLVNPYWFSKPFESTWRTSNTSTGSSTSTQVKLPLIVTGTYNFTVDWGDGSSNTITTWNQAQVTHTYSVAGTYTIKITGTCIGWKFNSAGDRLKILSVQSWGKFRPAADQAVFYGCSNLTLNNVTDTLDLTGTSSLMSFFFGCTSLTTIAKINEWNTSGIKSTYQMFRGCSNFNQPLSINTSDVTTMYEMFYGCTKFNQDLGGLDTSKVTIFNAMFQLSGFNNGSSASINLWNVISGLNFSDMFSSCPFNQNIGNWNVSNGTNFSRFMNGKTPATFSASNLDAIYNGWSSRPVKPSINIIFSAAKYTAASSAGRAILTASPNLWTIVDGGI